MAQKPENRDRRHLPGSRTKIGGRQGPLGPGGKYGYRRAHKQQEAAERQAERAKRTPAQQLVLLAKRPGKSAREWARLAAQLKESAEKESP